METFQYSIYIKSSKLLKRDGRYVRN